MSATTRFPSAGGLSWRSAFTLVELLVVVAIIGTLASLLLVAVNGAMKRARTAAIQVEARGLSDAFQRYTTDVSGGAYPPNTVWQYGIGLSGNTVPASVVNDLKRHFNAAFPKHREPSELIQALAGAAPTGVVSVGLTDPSDSNQGEGLSPYEALLFWLGGFSDDPKYPISGPGGPSFNVNEQEDFASRQHLFDFEVTRLGPRTEDGQFDETVGRYIEYTDPRNNGQTRRINLWIYFPSSREVPYAYWDASRKPAFDPVFDGMTPIKQLKLNAASQTVANIVYANQGKCQILSAGLDDDWGNMAANWGVDYSNGSADFDGILYPEGPFTGELADTITNFGEAATLEDSQP